MIALKRSNNFGGHYFISLYSGKRIHGYKWERLPIDEHIIERVEQLAKVEEQPIMNRGMSYFEWAPAEEIEDETGVGDKQRLAIANGCTEIGEQDQEQNQVIEDMQQRPEQLQDDLVNIDPDVIENDHVPIEDEFFEPNNEDGMIVLPEENIVSDEEGLVETETEEKDFDAYVPEVAIEDRVVALVALGVEETDAVSHTRPR